MIIYWKLKKIYHTVGTLPKSNSKIVEKDKIDTINTFLDCYRHFYKNKLKSDGVKLDLWTQTNPQTSTKQTIIYICNLLYRKYTATYDVGNSGLGQLNKCGRVKLLNFISITIHKIRLHIFQTVIMNSVHKYQSMLTPTTKTTSGVALLLHLSQSWTS